MKNKNGYDEIDYTYTDDYYRLKKENQMLKEQVRLLEVENE